MSAGKTRATRASVAAAPRNKTDKLTNQKDKPLRDIISTKKSFKRKFKGLEIWLSS